jgi:cellulose synthase operon protein C
MIRSAARSAALLAALAAGAHAQAPGALPATAVPGTATPSAAAKVLLDQANYWHAQNRPQDAERALDRLLLLEPDNADALGLVAQLQAERGDRAAAQASLTRLRAVRPDDPRIAAAEQAIRQGSVDPAGLAEARRLAQEGHNAEAIARYQRLFRGSEPPAGLAVEYYETLAGTQGGSDAAQAGLARVVAANPNNLRAQLAYAQLLTYQEPTRVEGIRRLAALAQNPEIASAAGKAWRQALEWLPIDAPSIPAYQGWLTGHPSDGGISALVEQARNPRRTPTDEAAATRSAGFVALNSGQIKEAEADFQAALAKNQQDPDALGGLGLVRLRQGNAAEARTLLSRAIAADPEHKARWEQALSGASVGEDYAAARTAVQRGQLDAAERQLRAIIARGGDVAGAQAMLADVLSRRGDLAGAEAQYRAVLARQPNNADALVGLAQVLGKQGRSAEAEALLDRAQSAGDNRAVGRIRADALRQQAAAAQDPAVKEALLRAAVGADPNDPWTRLDLARTLAATGKKLEARQVMAEVTGAAHPSVDALRAGALFASEDGRPNDATALIDRLPASARTPDMRALLAQAHLQTEIRNAMSLRAISPAAAREKLMTLAAQPDPDGARGVAIARAFLEMGNPAGAREALATAQAATREPTSAQRIAYAGILLQAGDERGAQILIHALDATTGLTPQQSADLNRLRAGSAIRQADALNTEGRQADAYDVLAPALSRDPTDPGLNMALGRLYARDDRPGKALAINQALLERDPANLDARRAALDAAIQARDWTGAEALVNEGKRLAPDDPRTWMMSATLNRARGNTRRALEDLKQAQALRRQEVGADLTTPGAEPTRIYQTAAQDEPLAPMSGNPFRRGAAPTPQTSFAPSLPAPAPSDLLSQDIDRQIAGLQEDLAPKLTVGPAFRFRTGTTGLDQLSEAAVPVALLVHPLDRGQLSVIATPTFLSAGQVPGDTQSQRLFGTGALGNTPVPPSQHAQGVGLLIGYEMDWLKADIGSSPLGFQQENVLGGLEVSPQITDGVRLRVLGERRAVTDSVLSYAGTQDPATGIRWGGVTRERGHAQLEMSVRDANFYAGGGYAALNGLNVESNTEYEMGAGGSYPVWRGQADNEVRIGLDLVYFAYDKNLRFFSLGQGGYFSPQSYFAALFPVHYSSKSDDLDWSIGGSVGYQVYNENSSPVFPDNAGLQNQLLLVAATTPGLLTSYPSHSASGIVGGAEGSLDYRVTDNFRIGGRASYQHAGNWSETIGTLFARYIFNGASR